MERICLGVVRRRSFRSADGFHVYGDRGTGLMDWAYPVTSRRRLFWPDAPVQPGHVCGGHLMAMHLDGVVLDGHLEGVHLLDEHHRPATPVVYASEPVVWGRFRHAIVTEDAYGNATTAEVTVHETVVNSDPPPASELVPVAHDGVTDRATFAFSPSDRLVG